jgi:RNA polymerase sigma-70 factor, ECF subfamily
MSETEPARADIIGVMEESDEQVWNRAQAGDGDSFATLFDRHGNKVYSYCFRWTGDWSLAEDLTSIVFLEAWRKRSVVSVGARGALPWLLGVAVNVIRNQRRSLRRYRAVLERIPPLEPETDFAEELVERLNAEDRARQLVSRIRALPRSERDVLTLYWEGLSNYDIAVALGIPEGTVRSRIFRARRRLNALAARSDGLERLAPPEGVNPQ